MTLSPGNTMRVKASRDWPLLAAAASAFLSLTMLFPPWLTGGGESQNAFGDALQTAGPALIIVMALATIASLVMAGVTANRRYVRAAAVSSSILLTVYVMKLADVSDLADLYSRLAESFTGASVGTGAGLWLGFVFALLTEAFVLSALVFKWGVGEDLVYPGFGRPQETRYGGQEGGDRPDAPRPPESPPGAPPERPTR